MPERAHAGPLYVPSDTCRVGAARVTSGGGQSRPIERLGACLEENEVTSRHRAPE